MLFSRYNYCLKEWLTSYNENLFLVDLFAWKSYNNSSFVSLTTIFIENIDEMNNSN